jgi:hypothetical protein
MAGETGGAGMTLPRTVGSQPEDIYVFVTPGQPYLDLGVLSIILAFGGSHREKIRQRDLGLSGQTQLCDCQTADSATGLKNCLCKRGQVSL